MLEDAELALDAVHVLLPPDLHARAANTLIQRGLHVLLEKPMAISAGECGELIEQAATRGVMVAVNHNFLFAPIYESLRRRFEERQDRSARSCDHYLESALDQLQSGPFDLWMLRDPRNIVLEIGPHCLAPVLDLLGPLEISSVNTSSRVLLRADQEFYRRWSIEGRCGPTAVTLHLSFSPGFTEQSIHVRGTVASATVDFERNTYLLHQHTRYGPDFDRYRMIRQDARSLAVQARRSLTAYALSKLKLSGKGNPYGLSISRALRSFYSGLGKSLDSRLSPELGRDITAVCTAIGRIGIGSPAESPAAIQPDGREARASETTSPAEVLILGATGFIGQALARQFVAAGHRIRLMVRNPARLPRDLQPPEIEIIRGDLTRAEDREKAIAGSRVVYHLARANVRTWEEFTEQDIEVTRQIADACLASGVHRLIYTGTIDSYYAGASAGTITETTSLDPQIAWRNLYARAKAASEDLLMASHRERGLPVIIVRPGIVIGQGGNPLHWGIGMWSWNAVCQVWGKGDNPLPLVLVEDVAQRS